MRYRIEIQQEDENEQDKYKAWDSIYEQVLVLSDDKLLKKVILLLNEEKS